MSLIGRDAACCNLCICQACDGGRQGVRLPACCGYLGLLLPPLPGHEVGMSEPAKSLVSVLVAALQWPDMCHTCDRNPEDCMVWR